MRSPRLIWRFLLADLGRLGLLSTAALVGVIAFAFSVRFLAEGRIDVGAAVRLMALAVVPMLQYALPFACGFAATLTYHRFAADNEATAAASGGVSHRATLAPVLALGVALSIGLVALSHQVIPRFMRSIEEIVTRDLTGVFVRAIERGEPVRLGAFEIHATDVARAGPDPAIGATDRLRLRGVLAVQLNDDNKVEGYIAADEVGVWLFDDDSAGQPATAAQLVFKGASGESDKQLIRGETVASQRVRVPNAFSTDPKHLTFRELRALRQRPENLPKIEALRRALATRLAEERALTSVRDDLARTGSSTLSRVGGETLTITARGLREEGGRWILDPAPATGLVRVDRTLASGSTVRLTAPAAWLEPDTDASWSTTASAPAAVLRFVADTPGSLARERQVVGAIYRDLAPQSPTSAADALATARTRLTEPALLMREPITLAARQLASRVADLQREITSKLHERAAYAVACLLTMLCGAVTALRRESSMPLPVYLWSFFPALAAVITISAGQGLTHKSGDAGLFLLWGGVAALALFVAREYARLARH